MQGRDAVVFLEIGCFGGDLCCVELDLFGILLSLDFDEAAFDRLFHRFRQICPKSLARVCAPGHNGLKTARLVVNNS